MNNRFDLKWVLVHEQNRASTMWSFHAGKPISEFLSRKHRLRAGRIFLGVIFLFLGLALSIFGILFDIIGLALIINGLVSSPRRPLPYQPSPQVIYVQAPQQANQPTVIKETTREIVKVPCRYCGGLVTPATDRFCPSCGAPFKM